MLYDGMVVQTITDALTSRAVLEINTDPVK
jgi:hypothetical protein